MSLNGTSRAVGTEVRFPAVSFGSYAEFAAYREQSRGVLDARYRHERALAVPPGRHVRAGTCAPCLRQARFTVGTEGGERLDDATIVPNFREQLICDCADRLNNRHRALLHFVASALPWVPWRRVLAFGRLSAAETRLCRRLGETAFVPRLMAGEGGAARIAVPDAAFHLVVSLDYLHHVPSLMAAIGELRRVIVPGGMLVFTVPFRWDRPATRSHAAPPGPQALALDSPREVHEIGWDLLEMLHGSGFTRARAHVYWSEELGYLGPFNTIFSAET
jgi:hypothetical protein